MNELASPGQLRLSYWRWALFIIPLTVLLGFAMGQLFPSGSENRWYMALTRPAAEPPGWVFGVAWGILYIMIGAALAVVLNARSAPLRWPAVALWIVQFLLNLAWTPLFFGMHQVTNAFYLLVLIFALATVTTLVFGRIRNLAAWLMVPYLAWLCFACILNKQIDDLNPSAETLIVPAESGAVRRSIG